MHTNKLSARNTFMHQVIHPQTYIGYTPPYSSSSSSSSTTTTSSTPTASSSSVEMHVKQDNNGVEVDKDVTFGQFCRSWCLICCSELRVGCRRWWKPKRAVYNDDDASSYCCRQRTLLAILLSEFMFSFVNTFVIRALRRAWRYADDKRGTGYSDPTVAVDVAVAATACLYMLLSVFHNVDGHVCIATQSMLNKMWVTGCSHSFFAVATWLTSLSAYIGASVAACESVDYLFVDTILSSNTGVESRLIDTSKFHSNYRVSFTMDEKLKAFISSFIFFSLFMHYYSSHKNTSTHLFVVYFISLVLSDGISGDTLNFLGMYDTSAHSWFTSNAFQVFGLAQISAACAVICIKGILLENNNTYENNSAKVVPLALSETIVANASLVSTKPTTPNTSSSSSSNTRFLTHSHGHSSINKI